MTAAKKAPSGERWKKSKDASLRLLYDTLISTAGLTGGFDEIFFFVNIMAILHTFRELMLKLQKRGQYYAGRKKSFNL